MIRRLAGLLVACFALSPVFAVPAWGQADESITSFQSSTVIRADGMLDVTEVITYDFGPNERHGIFRRIPQRFEGAAGRDRLYPISNVSVTAEPPGTPDAVDTSVDGRFFVIRIGDEDRFVSGVHTYRISYRVKGALNAFADHDELFWNISGPDWEVPIARVDATVQAPADITRIECFEGPTGSTDACAVANVAGSSAQFSTAALSPSEQLTVVVAIPKGAVPEPVPVFARTIADGFELNAVIAGSALAITAGLVWGIGRLFRRVGRDRKYRGSAVDQMFGSADGSEETMDWGDDGGLVPVLFEPPDGVRPGLVGTLTRERAEPLDVTATIVDLASRGFLEITEIPKKGWFGKTDWRLDRKAIGSALRDEADPDRREGSLLLYERKLLNSLFADGDSVELSDLKDKFADELKAVQDALYDDVVHRGWFGERPDKTRSKWVAAGVFAAAGAGGLTYLLATKTSLGVLGFPFIIASLLLLAAAPRMPRRTAKGTAALTHVRGFRRFMAEGEKHRSEFEERKNLFTEYLPYAVVFGVTEKWANAFAGLDGELPQPYWYHGNGSFTASSLSSSFDDFSSAASDTLASTPSSSGSSGFGGSSGGGGGGGGGGSW